mgnify:CR=1 FL=1
MFDEIDQRAVTTLRMLSIDTIQAAGSGHPGLPLGAAPMAYVLYRNHLRVDPKNQFFNRDRFVLSAGHGSAMLYALNHMAGFDISRDDLMHFRKLGSRTPGHPEYGHTPGVDATTGPLGQGIAMAVGMAAAERHLGAQYNQGATVVDHNTYVLVGDGDLMEGVSHEAASLAGQLKLGKLIVLYDSNDVSLDGPKSRSCTDDAQQRFASYGWNVQLVEDGNDLDAIDAAITNAKAVANQPSLIEVRTQIGYGTPDAGTNKIHGNLLSAEGYQTLCQHLNWTEPAFTVPDAVRTRLAETFGQRGHHAAKQALAALNDLRQVNAQLAEDYMDAVAGQLPEGWRAELPTFAGEAPLAGRLASQRVIQAAASAIGSLWGGAADLASSIKTDIAGSSLFASTAPEARNIGFGVREFAEACAMNGIALHGGSRIFGGTFLVFSDYMKPAIRLAAMQHLPVIYVFTHDSLAVGEDGPTHQPVEQLMALRSIPGLQVLRPVDARGVAVAWEQAIAHQDGPTALILSRQDQPALPINERDEQRGGYVLSPVPAGRPHDGILIATGTEAQLALKVQKVLAIQDVYVSVVALPSFEIFADQPSSYRDRVLPPHVRRRMSLEMGATLGWERYVGLDGVAFGVDTFGASGAPDAVMRAYGFTAIHVADAFTDMMTKSPLKIIRKIG